MVVMAEQFNATGCDPVYMGQIPINYPKFYLGTIAPWCNVSTVASEAISVGQNPAGAAKILSTNRLGNLFLKQGNVGSNPTRITKFGARETWLPGCNVKHLGMTRTKESDYTPSLGYKYYRAVRSIADGQPKKLTVAGATPAGAAKNINSWLV